MVSVLIQGDRLSIDEYSQEDDAVFSAYMDIQTEEDIMDFDEEKTKSIRLEIEKTKELAMKRFRKKFGNTISTM